MVKETIHSVLPTTKEEVAKERPHLYMTPQSPSFTMQFPDHDVKAENGLIRFTDDEHEFLKDLVRNGQRPDILQNLRAVDQAEVEAAQEVFTRAQAHRGAAGSTANSERLHEAAGNHANFDEVTPRVPEGTSETAKAAIAASRENILNNSGKSNDGGLTLAQRLAAQNKD